MLATAIHKLPRGFIDWNPQTKTRALVAWLKEKPAPHDVT